MTWAVPPACSISRDVATSGASWRPTRTVFAPSVASRIAVARPSPRPAPVIRAVRPLSGEFNCTHSLSDQGREGCRVGWHFGSVDHVHETVNGLTRALHVLNPAQSVEPADHNCDKDNADLVILQSGGVVQRRRRHLHLLRLWWHSCESISSSSVSPPADRRRAKSSRSAWWA